MAGKIKCAECKYCKDSRRYGNTRGSFHCEHPDKKYILEYFKDYKIHKMEGFIGFGKPFENTPSIKTSPAWCPKKKQEGK
jgi:hypothetical protein